MLCTVKPKVKMGNKFKPTLVLLLERFLNETYIKEEVGMENDYFRSLMNDEPGGDEGGPDHNKIHKEDDDIDENDQIKRHHHRLDAHDKDLYQHFASVLTNMMQIEASRKFLMRIP